jgi:hypothetical protein
MSHDFRKTYPYIFCRNILKPEGNMIRSSLDVTFDGAIGARAVD